MTRSYNSRKGSFDRCNHRNCDICHPNYDKHVMDDRWKRNWKKFYGRLYSHKHKKKTYKKAILQGYNVERELYKREPQGKKKKYRNKSLDQARKEYREWSWLKGKPNKKGICHTWFTNYIFWSPSKRLR